MKKAIPRVLVSIGILFLVAAGALLIYSLVDDQMAEQRADSILQLVSEDGWEQVELTETEEEASSGFFSLFHSAEALENTEEAPESSSYTGAPLVYSVIGILEIPRLNKKLPVLDRSIPALLRKSVCRYTGRMEEKPIRLVIAGHNYRSHFGEIHKLQPGDEIRFTTPEGVTYRYAMVYMEECHMDDRDAVQEGEGWDITLLTCKKPERTYRYLVRFAEITG